MSCANPVGRDRALPRQVILLGSLLLFVGTASSPQSAEEILRPGHAGERPIMAGEMHVYRIEVAEAPLLLTIEQKSINVVVETQGPITRLKTDGAQLLFGTEVLLLESPGEHRLEIHPGELAVSSGRYAIQVETPPEDVRLRRALSLMSRASQEAMGNTPEARRGAVASFREALAEWRSLGERRWEAEALDAIGILEAKNRELQPAVEDFLQARALWRELAEPLREAASSNELGLAYSYIGELDAARNALESALALWRDLGERFGEGLTRSNLCFLEQRSGALPAALACYEEPLALFRELGDRVQEIRLLNNIGGLYYEGLGEPDAALVRFEQALALRRELGDRRGEAETLNNIAAVHRALGEWQEALRLYGQVREILVQLGDRFQQAVLLHNVGSTYNGLGEPQRALSFLEAALELRRAVGDRRGESVTLNNLGDAWLRLGDPAKGLEQYRRAFEVAVALGDPRQEALTRLRLVEARLEQNDPAGTLHELDPALGVLSAMGLRRREAQALQLRGRALAQAQRPGEALPVFQDVLARCRSLRDRPGEAEALQALAATERALGLQKEAHAHADEAVGLVEELRTGFVSPDLRAAFLATQRRAYALVIDLLMDRHAAEPGAGHDRAAFAISERARARGLVDVLGSGSAVPAGSPASARLLEQRQTLRRRLSTKVDQQLKQSGVPADALAREIETLLAELDTVEAEIRRSDPHSAAVSGPRALGVEEVAGLLDSDTLLLEYSLGEGHSYLWVVGAGSFHSFVLPPRQDIEAPARQLYEELSIYEAGARRQEGAAETLSRLLLGPAWSEVQRSRRLIVVPDAALHVLPFGALPAPGSGGYLLEQLEIAYLPSATTLALQRQRLEGRAPASRWAAVVADPVFTPDDPRLAGPAIAGAATPPPPRIERDSPEIAPLASLERLPATRREADAIKELAPVGQVWTALGLEARREAVLSRELHDSRIVHFATHGLADTRNSELSGLVLSLVDAAGRPQEGFLSLTDISELDLAADLVVLSGCRTALGKEVRGEGIMGLTRGFLHAGVPRVVASLWRVEDRTTAELMTHFYRALWQDRLPPAAALRAAQQSMRRDRRYRAPYSWAGFVLQGDWR